MKSLNSFINFRSSRPNLQSSYISLDRWLTVGSPSGLNAKWMLKLVAVLAILLTVGVGHAWGDVLTITSNNVQTGSYPTSEATFTLSSTYTFGYMQMYNPNANNNPSGWKAGQTIQSKKDATNYGRLYNKTSIVGLSKIRLWILSGNDITTYTGSSMISSTPGSGGISLPSAAGSESVTYETATKSGKTWSYGTSSINITYYDIDVPAGHSYFYIKNNNSSTTQIYKIELFYSTCTPLGTINGSVNWSNAATAVVSWDNLDHVSSWTVKYKTHAAGAYTTWAGEQSTAAGRRSVTITGLTPCTDYDFQIIANPASGYCDKDQTIEDSQTHNWTVTKTGVTNVTAASLSAIPATTCTSGFGPITITAATGYALPADITVTNATKSWNSSTGALSISSVTGNVSITITPTCVSPVITADPADADYYVGDAPTALSVTATLASGTRTYLWKVSTNGGSTWSDAAGTNNTASYSGASLSTASAGTLKFKCIVGNSEGGCTVESGVATITVSNASYFPNGKTLFFEAKTKEESAWKDNAQCKAWFRDCDSGCGEAPWTYWQTDGDSYKKYYAVVIPSTGSYPYVTIQRFSDYTGNTPWGEGGAQTYSTGGGSNVIKSTCASGECLSWSPTSMQIYLRGDITNDEWASNIGEMTDQNGGIWSYTYANYSSSGSTLAFKLYTNYNTWIGNTTDNSNAVLEGMKDGSTYNITATYNIVDHSLTMSKTFVKGTVHFDMQGHGSVISDLTNVTAGSKISAPSPAPSVTGWDFGGWFKEPACTNEWNFATDEVSETMTLYAKWTAQEYTIAKTLTNVSSSPAIPSTYTYTGSAAGLNYTITPSSGYRLPTTISVSGTTYTWNPATGALALTGTIANDVTISIVAVQTHTVTWLSNGENYVSPVVYDHGATLAFPASDPSAPSSCSEKVFVGWTSDSEITSETSTRPTIISAGGAVNADATYRAVFADEEEGDPEPGKEHSWNANYTAWGGSTTHSWLRNNNAKLPTFEYTPSPSYSIQSVELQYSQSNETGSNTIAVFVGDTQIGSTQNASGTNSNYTTYTFTNGTALSGKVRIVLTNTSANTTGQGTFYLYYIKLIEPGAPGVSYDNYITQCCSLKPVTSLAVSGTTANSVTLSWTAPSPTTGIDHLELRNASTDAKIGSDIAVGTTSTTVSGLVECNTYSYKIVSVGASCETSSEVVDAQPFSGAKTVTYNYHEGSGGPASFTTSCGNTTTTLPTPTRTNYRFDGWYTEASGGTRKGGGGDSYTPDATITLHAQWTRVYTVSYAYAGGSGSCAGGSYAAGETVTTCATATKAGSTLTGWMRSDNSATVTPGNTFTMPASNVTLTAVWEDTPYTLTQNIGSHTTKGYTTATIKSGDLASSGLDLTYTISDNAYALPKAVTISGGGQTWTLGTNYTWSLSEDKHSATLHIGADLTISADVTVTVSEQARYTVIWDEHGSTTTEYYAADDNSVTMKTGIADCGEKKFYGWTEDAVFASHATTPPTMASSGAISADKHYYAIFADADEPANPGYNKVTTVSNGIYIIATYPNTASGKAYKIKHTNDSYGDAASVTFTQDGSNNYTIIATDDKGEAGEFTVEVDPGNSGHFSIYSEADDKYLTGANSFGGFNYGDSKVYEWELSSGQIYNIQTTKWKNNSGNYVRGGFRSNSASSDRWATYNVGGQVSGYLYKKETTTYSNFAKTCTLYDISIAATSDGTVTTTPSAGTGAAGEGQTVTVNVTPNSCKYLSALKYNDGSDHAISIASAPYTFTMPAADVTVTATFEDKTVSSIAPNTDSHRVLMEGTAFVGEQIRVTYNNGETEDLAWDASGLTFSGYNMSTLGEQTVSVAYSGSCGSANTSYSIEITDGIPVTFSDCGITETIKYDPDALVNLDSKNGAYACSGWEFVGWSESSVAANSTSFTPVRNFNASTARTLYAVYAHIRVNGSSIEEYKSADRVNELREGARYVIAGWVNSNTESYGMTAMLPSVTADHFLNGTHSGSSGFTYTEVNESGSYRYYSTATLAANAHWQLMADGTGYWQLYNRSAGKYLDLTNFNPASDINTAGYAEVSTTPNGKIVVSDYNTPSYGNDSKIHTRHSTSNDTHSLSWDRTNSRFNQWKNATVFYLTKDEYFSSNPPCAPQAAIFHGNGGTVIAYGGSPTGGDLTIREATRDAGIKTPTAAYDDCDGKSWTFVGWLDDERDVTRIPVLTTELLNDGGGNKAHDITTDGEEFWAVYTNQGEALTKYGTISFSMSDFSKNYLSEEHTVTKVVSGDNYVFGDKKIGHASDTGIQFEAGTGELYNKTSLGKINSISFGSFEAGALSNLKVYVGNSEKATTYELTAAELQVVGGVSTYYPTNDCEYVYIKSGGTYACVTSISIDFGKGTKVWATTPDCKRVTLSGDIYATATQDRSIMAVTPLHVNAFQLDASAGIVISSNSSDVYFSTDRNANFAKAESSKPKSKVTVNADAEGNLSTDVYVHYKPSSAGDGVPADVNVYANLAVPDPSVTATHSIHVRNMPEKFVIAAKVGATWYALPADMSTETNPSGVVIEVDETNMTAVAPNTCSYTIWPVKTTNTSYDRYALQGGNAYGDRVRFSAVNNGNKGLWANNAASGNGINNYAVIASVSDGETSTNTNPAYEWKITTTIVDGKWQYTLQTDQTQNDRYLRYWFAATGGPKWGTYASGEQNLYFLPVTEVEPFEMQVVEWYPTKVLVQTEAALSSPTVKIGGEAVASPVLTGKGTHLYEISGLPLESNPTKAMTVSFTADAKNYACTKTVPVIISRGAKTQASEPFATLGTAIYNTADLVVRDGAVLTVDGSNAANTFYDVTIYPTSKISVSSSKKLTVHALTFFGGIDEIYDGSAYAVNKYGVPELSLKGTLRKSIAQIDYVMRVDTRQMYSLTVPYNVNLSEITYWDGTSMGTLGDKLWVSAYNGANRAAKSGSTWIYETDFDPAQLIQGVGYTISADKQESDHEYSIIRMPMKSNVAYDETEAAKTVAVTAYGKDTEVSDNHKGWNLVGNPYMVSISGGEPGSQLVVGKLVESGTGPWDWDGTTYPYRYVTIPFDDGTDYYQQKFSEATLKPFKNFFLQIANTGDLSFALESRQNAPARYLEVKEREVEFEVLLNNGARQDNTGLLIAEKYSPAYEINADLEKIIGSMAVYTIYGGYNLAYNALSPAEAAQLIPMGYVAPAAGEYTFLLDEQSDYGQIEHIYLTDYEQSRTVDLLDDTYVFTTDAGKNESRFAINVILKEEGSELPTGVDVIGGDKDDGIPLKFIREDKIYILRNGIIYDATGKKVGEIK